METPAKGIIRLGIGVAFVLLLGAGAVFALNQREAGVKADRVTIIKSEGITCGSCAAKIEKALREKPGVASVEVDIESGGIAVAYDAGVAKPEMLAGAVTALGYESSVYRDFSADEFKALTGKNVASPPSAKSGGCGCCNKNRK